MGSDTLTIVSNILHISANGLKHAVGFGYGQNFLYRAALSQFVTASGSVHSFSCGSGSLDPDNDGSGQVGTEIPDVLISLLHPS